MFKTGQIIRPRGSNNDNMDLYTVVYMDRSFVQAINMKDSGFISIPRSAENTYKLATDSDIQSYISRYLKYHLIQNYSDGGKWKVNARLVKSL